MLVGIGVDLVLITRIRAILNKHGERFLKRVFSSSEIRDSQLYSNEEARIRHFAKRFAAKEAYVKAIGTGFGGGIESKNISVSNDKYGKPTISIIGDKKRVHFIDLSMSDDGDYAIAFVTVYNKPDTTRS